MLRGAVWAACLLVVVPQCIAVSCSWAGGATFEISNSVNCSIIYVDPVSTVDVISNSEPLSVCGLSANIAGTLSFTGTQRHKLSAQYITVSGTITFQMLYITAANINITSGAILDGAAKINGQNFGLPPGFPGTCQTMSSVSCGGTGAFHANTGGTGAHAASTDGSPVTYGSLSMANTTGSQGGNGIDMEGETQGGAGGGSIIIDAYSFYLANSAMVTVNGGDAPNNYGGGGSGGSIYIRTMSLCAANVASSIFSASGGQAIFGGGGSGGYVVILYQYTGCHSPFINALGGASDCLPGFGGFGQTNSHMGSVSTSWASCTNAQLPTSSPTSTASTLPPSGTTGAVTLDSTHSSSESSMTETASAATTSTTTTTSTTRGTTTTYPTAAGTTIPRNTATSTYGGAYSASSLPATSTTGAAASGGSTAGGGTQGSANSGGSATTSTTSDGASSVGAQSTTGNRDDTAGQIVKAPPSGSSNSSSVTSGVIAAIVILVLLVLGAAIAAAIYFKRQQKPTQAAPPAAPQHANAPVNSTVDATPPQSERPRSARYAPTDVPAGVVSEERTVFRLLPSADGAANNGSSNTLAVPTAGSGRPPSMYNSTGSALELPVTSNPSRPGSNYGPLNSTGSGRGSNYGPVDSRPGSSYGPLNESRAGSNYGPLNSGRPNSMYASSAAYASTGSEAPVLEEGTQRYLLGGSSEVLHFSDEGTKYMRLGAAKTAAEPTQQFDLRATNPAAHVTELLAAGSTTLLGSGATADVFRVKLGREWVAVKKFKHESPAALAEFHAEVSVLSRVADAAHPHVLGLAFICTEPSMHAIVVEMADGGSLQGCLDGSLSLNVAQKGLAIGGVASGMAFLHTNQIAHQDLKPANVLRMRNGTIKIADFGSSYLCDAGDDVSAGAFHGTPQYSAPERLATDGRRIHLLPTDVYAFGVTVWAIFAGRLPFSGETVPNVVAQKTTQPSTTLYPKSWSGSDPMYALVMRCCDLDPSQRPTFAKVLEALSSVDATPNPVFAHSGRDRRSGRFE